MTRQRPVYEERTPWAGWVHALLWGALTAAGYPLLAGWDTDLPFVTRLLLVCALVGFGAGLQVFFSGTTVRVLPDRVRVFLGTAPLIATTIPLEEISEVTSVRYRPIREFGGWGLRGTRRRRAWTARGDQAVVLTLGDGRKVYLGSDHPRRLEERIRAAMRD